MTKNKEILKNSDFLCCMSRSFDKNAIDKKRIHLISSIYKLQENFCLDESVVENIIKILKKNRLKKIIILIDWKKILLEDMLINFNDKIKYHDNLNFLIECNELMLIQVSALGLIYEYFKFQGDNFFESLIGGQSWVGKEVGNNLGDVLFVFREFDNLNSIINFMKILDINISGGSISSRLALNSVQSNLMTFLYLLKIVNLFPKVSIHNSYNEITYSKKINNKDNLDMYNKYKKIYYWGGVLFRIKELIDKINQDIELKNKFNQDIQNKFIIKEQYNIDLINQSENISKNDKLIKTEEYLNNIKFWENEIVKYSKVIEELTLKIKKYQELINNLNLQGDNSFELLENMFNLLFKEIPISDLKSVNNQSLGKNKIMEFKNNSLGKKRKYSTSSIVNENINYKDSTMNDKSIKVDKLNDKKLYFTSEIKDINNRNIYYYQIKKIIENNIANEETQKQIELMAYQNKLNNNDSNYLWDQLANVSNDFNKFLFNCANELISKITHLKNNSNDSSSIYFDNLKIKDITKLNSLKQKKRNEILCYKILSELKQDIIISILLGKVLFIINNPSIEENYSTNVFIKIGSKLINSYFHYLYNKEKVQKHKNYSNYWLSNWKIENKEFVECFENDDADNTLKASLGALGIEWLLDSDLLEFAYNRVDENNTLYIKISKKLSHLVLNNKTIPLNIPNKLPMIVKPKYFKKIDNKAEILGGYLLNDELYQENIIIHNSRLNENSNILENNIIYDTINNLSSVGYKINKNVYNFIIKNNDKFNLTLINATHPLENKKDRLGKHQLIELTSFKSKRFVDESILNIANCYINADEIFIPTRIDYRGRIYCNTSYLNYQGTELAKSLLMFSKGERINIKNKDSINYLKIFGANCFGNKLDKKSIYDRINWVDVNFDNIFNFENGILIKQAESKLLFIAFCFEFKKYILSKNDENGYFLTHLPIQLDATCNGFQHISMLGMDKELNENLNIKASTWSDAPDDFYSVIAYLVKGSLKNKIESNKNEDLDKLESYNRLFNLDIQRSMIKKCVMTIPYNASRVQSIKYLKEVFEYIGVEDEENNTITNEIWLKYKQDNNIRLKNEDFWVLYDTLFEVIYEIAPSIRKISDYLKTIAKICSTANTFIPWILPNGLIVKQSYTVMTEIRISPFNYSKYTYNIQKKIKNSMDTRKNIRAFMPNLIHSLDAASLSILINNYFYQYDNEIKNIFGIHDCFSTTFNNMEYIIDTLKLIYISIYSDKKYLENLDKNIINHIKNNIDESFDNINIKTVSILNKNNKKIKIKYPDINEILNNNYDLREYILKSSYLIN